MPQTPDELLAAKDNTLHMTAVLNHGLKVHDWYIMPEAYSEPLIVEAIERFGLGAGDTIRDPTGNIPRRHDGCIVRIKRHQRRRHRSQPVFMFCIPRKAALGC